MINTAAVAKYVFDRWARKEPTPIARELLAHRIVVRIEQVSVLISSRGVVGQLRQDEGFKKPGRVRQVPASGAHVWHRLNATVLWLKRVTQSFAELTYFPVALEKLFGWIGWRCI